MTSLFGTSNMTPAWPPMSEETAARLKRLEELQQKRLESEKRLQEQRAANAAGSARAAEVTSRRSTLGGSSSRLAQGRELRLKSYKERLGGSVNSDIGTFNNQTADNKDFGGARPKVVGSSLGVDRTVSLGRDRYLSTDTEDEDSNKLVKRSQSYTLLTTEPALETYQGESENLSGMTPAEPTDDGQKKGESEKMEDDSMEEENFEQFRDSLYGKSVSKTKPEFTSLLSSTRETKPEFSSFLSSGRENRPEFSSILTSSSRENKPEILRDKSEFSILGEPELSESSYEYSSNTFPRKSSSSIANRYKPRRGLHSAVKESINSIDALFDSKPSRVSTVRGSSMLTNTGDSNPLHSTVKESISSLDALFDSKLRQVSDVRGTSMLTNTGDSNLFQSNRFELGTERTQPFSVERTQPFSVERTQPFSVTRGDNIQGVTSYMSDIGTEKQDSEPIFGSESTERISLDVDTKLRSLDSKIGEPDTSSKSYEKKPFKSIDAYFDEIEKVPDLRKKYDTDFTESSDRYKRSSILDRQLSDPMSRTSYTSDRRLSAPAVRSSYTYSAPTTGSSLSSDLLKDVNTGSSTSFVSRFRQNVQPSDRSSYTSSSDRYQGGIYQARIQDIISGGMKKLDSVFGMEGQENRTRRTGSTRTQVSRDETDTSTNLMDNILTDFSNKENVNDDESDKVEVICNDTFMKVEDSPKLVISLERIEEVHNENDSITEDVKEQSENQVTKDEDKEQKSTVESESSMETSSKGDNSSVSKESKNKDDKKNAQNKSISESPKTPDKGKGKKKNKKKNKKKKDATGLAQSPKGDKSENIVTTDSIQSENETKPNQTNATESENQDSNKVDVKSEDNSSATDSNVTSAESSPSKIKGFFNALLFGRDSSKTDSPTKENNSEWEGTSVDGVGFTAVKDEKQVEPSSVSVEKKQESNSDENSTTTSLENFETASEATDTSDAYDSFYEVSEDSQKIINLDNLEISIPTVERREIFINEPVGMKFRRKPVQEKRFTPSNFRSKYGQGNKGVFYFGQDRNNIQETEEEEKAKTPQKAFSSLDYLNRNNAYDFTNSVEENEDSTLSNEDRKGSETPDTLIETSDIEIDRDINERVQGVINGDANNYVDDADLVEHTYEQDVIFGGIANPRVFGQGLRGQIVDDGLGYREGINSDLVNDDVIADDITDDVTNNIGVENYLSNDFQQTIFDNDTELEIFTEVNGISSRSLATQTEDEYVSNIDLLLQKVISLSGSSSDDKCISVAEQIILKQFCEKCKLLVINNQGPSTEGEVKGKKSNGIKNGAVTPKKDLQKSKMEIDLSSGKKKSSPPNGNTDQKPPTTPRSNGKARDINFTRQTSKSGKKSPSQKRSPKATPPASPRSTSLTRKSPASTPTTRLSPKASPGQNRRGKVKGINEMLYDRQNSTGSSEKKDTEQKSSSTVTRSESEIKRIAEQLYSAGSESSQSSKKKLPPALLPKPYVSREKKVERQNSSDLKLELGNKTSSDVPSYMSGTKSSQIRNNSVSEKKQLNESMNSEKSPNSDKSSNSEKSDTPSVPSYMAGTKSSRSRSNSLGENKILKEVFNSEQIKDIPTDPKSPRSRPTSASRSRNNSASRSRNNSASRSPSNGKSRSRSNSISEKKEANGNTNTEKPDSDVPSYMSGTKSSRSRSNSLSKKKNGSPSKRRNSKQGNPEEDGNEHISSFQNNPFIQNDAKKRKSSKKDKGFKSTKQTETVTGSKNSGDTITLDYGVQSENLGSVAKKQNVEVLKPVMLVEYPASQHLETTFTDHVQTTNISSDGTSAQRQNFNDDRRPLSLRSDSASTLTSSKTSLTSGHSLLETDLDAAMGFSSRGESDDVDSRSDISETSSHLSFAEEACSGLTNMEYIDNNTKSVEKVKKREKTPSRSSNVEGKPPQSPREQEKEISQEEAAGVPIETGDNNEDDEIAPKRINLRDWDPHLLLKDLYRIEMVKDDVQDISDKFINMEGLMEKLPMNKKKATLLKTWKRRFFRAKDGWLHYYETSNRDKPSDSIQLMGGRVDDLGNRILGIDDGRGRYLMVRCPTENEYGQWKLALDTQTADNVKATYIRPCLKSPPNSNKKIIVIDLGSSGIRAGILGQEATLPEVFFPSVIARERNSGTLVVGEDAFKPNIRHKSIIQKPVRPTTKGDKDQLTPLSIDMDSIQEVFKIVFERLKLQDIKQYWIMLSTPQTLGDKIKEGLMKILVEEYQTQGVCMVQQSLLALYSYNATSGVIVDVGERMEILPIYDGYVIEGGVSRQSYGGPKVAESLKSSLIENKYKFLTPVEQFIVRHVMEQSCYVSSNYKDSVSLCERDPESCRASVYLNNYDLPEGAHLCVTHDLSCFKSPEGFFNSDMWGMDYPCVHKLVFQAIQSCPIDSRKHMYRSVYLSGGTTLLPGFAERLQSELTKLAPPAVVVEVHGSPQRYHAAFIGACAMAKMAPTDQTFISADEWKKMGHKSFKKWSMGGS